MKSQDVLSTENSIFTNMHAPLHFNQCFLKVLVTVIYDNKHRKSMFVCLSSLFSFLFFFELMLLSPAINIIPTHAFGNEDTLKASGRDIE